MDRDYFAALPTEEAGRAIYAKIEQFYNQIDSLGYFGRVSKAHSYYYGGSGSNTASGRMFSSSYVGRDGEQGEQYTFKINTFRNLIQHLLVMTTAERPQMEAQATNTDSESLSQADLGNELLEHYMNDARLEKLFVQCCEYAIVYAGGHIEVVWDTEKGKQYGATEQGKVLYDGDLSFNLYTPLDVIIDIYKDSNNHIWKAVRKYVNKYDLAASNPDLAEKILSSTTKDQKFDRYAFNFKTGSTSSDDVAVYRFYHEATPSMPDGRLIELIDGGDVLFDGPLPYDNLPVYSMYSARIADMPFGYSVAFDLLAIQEGLDTLHSSILTNNSAFGTQLIAVPKGHGINLQSLGKGLAVIEYDSQLGKPEPLQLTRTAPETYNYADKLDMLMEKTSGLNSIVRGQPQGQLTGASGSAMALLAATAQQFNQGQQREFEHLVEDVGTAIIKTLQRYASTPRVAAISGRTKRSQLREFKDEDIMNIDRVRVTRKSAISRTTAGKLEIARDLMNLGFVENPEQYAEAIKTGTIEPMFENITSRSLLIRKENEKLRNGVVPLVLRTDLHPSHISEHLSVLDDPDVRENPQLVQAVLAHVSEHEMYLNGGPQGGGAPGAQPQGGGAPGALDPNAGMIPGAQPPNMPNMPSAPPGSPEDLAEGVGNIPDPNLPEQQLFRS